MSARAKAILSGLVIAGVFGLCGIAVYRGDMSITAAVATCLSALTSAGVLGALTGKKDEEVV